MSVTTLLHVGLAIVCVIAMPAKTNAHVIGEIFEDTVYGKPSDTVKIEGGSPLKHLPERLVYDVTFSSRMGKKTAIVAVSKNTRRIFLIRTTVRSIEDAALEASYFCEGEVYLPTKAVWADGLILENRPGPNYKGCVFAISVNGSVDDGYVLKVECPTYSGEHAERLRLSEEALNERLRLSEEALNRYAEELRRKRDEYFKKQGIELKTDSKP
jgi:hypothetical protein